MRRFVVSGEVNEEVVSLEVEVPRLNITKEKQAAILRQCYSDLGIEVFNIGIVDRMIHEVCAN